MARQSGQQRGGRGVGWDWSVHHADVQLGVVSASGASGARAPEGVDRGQTTVVGVPVATAAADIPCHTEVVGGDDEAGGHARGDEAVL